MYSQIIRIALLHIVYHPQAVIKNGKQWRRLVCYFDGRRARISEIKGYVRNEPAISFYEKTRKRGQRTETRNTVGALCMIIQICTPSKQKW